MDSERNILVICPTARDRLHLSHPSIRATYNLQFHGTDELTHSAGFDVLRFLHEIFARIESCPAAYQGVVGIDDFPACMLAALVADRFGFSGASFQSLFLCQHKYYSRVMQRQAVPDATPIFQVIDMRRIPDPGEIRLAFPVFLKPAKSYMSILARQINTFAELVSAVGESREIEQVVEMMDALTSASSLPSEFRQIPASSLILEELLWGRQVTLDGYVFAGQVVPLGVVDSIFVPNSLSFERFEYPSQLPPEVQERMARIAVAYIRHIGLDRTFFDIEFFYREKDNSIWIIEVNPRMSSQFVPLYRMIDGIDLYSMQLQMALGIDPKAGGVWAPRRNRDLVSASFVLRRFQDAVVAHIPQQEDLESLRKSYPEIFVELLVRQGMRLSDELQDGRSYRYALIDLCAKGWGALYDRFEEVRQLLPFSFDMEH